MIKIRQSVYSIHICGRLGWERGVEGVDTAQWTMSSMWKGP